MLVKKHNNFKYHKITVTALIIFFEIVGTAVAFDGSQDQTLGSLLSAKITIDDLKSRALFDLKRDLVCMKDAEYVQIEKLSFHLHIRPFDVLCDICKTISDNEGVSIFMEILDKHGDIVTDIPDPLEEVAKQMASGDLSCYKENIKEAMEKNQDWVGGYLRLKDEYYVRLKFKHKLRDSEYSLSQRAQKIIKGFFSNKIERADGSIIDVEFSPEEEIYLYQLRPEDYRFIMRSLSGDGMYYSPPTGIKACWKRPDKASETDDHIVPIDVSSFVTNISESI